MRELSVPTSEVTSPERRGFIVVLGAMSVLFLAVEGVGAPEQPAYVLAARLLMTALLLAAPVLLARPLPPLAVAGVVHGFCAGVCLSFAAIAWGTGGTESPYFAFLPMLALVFTIAVPDVPLGSLLAGVCAGGVGLARVWVEGARAPQAAFWVLAFASTTTYAVAGSLFNRRQRARERRLIEERAHVEEVLAESERQRARAERLALVGRLAAGVARDLANPLSAGAASVAALERSVAAASRDEAGDVAATIADVRAALQRIRRTVDDLERFAKADLEASEGCDLRVVVEEARLRLAERFRASVRIVHDPRDALPPVHVVRARLVNALVWILADASGHGVCAVRVAARQEGDAVIVDLRDEGAGLAVAPLDLPAATIGEPGLALALAREELLRARCEVEGPSSGSGPSLPLRIRCGAADGCPARAAVR